MNNYRALVHAVRAQNEPRDASQDAAKRPWLNSIVMGNYPGNEARRIWGGRGGGFFWVWNLGCRWSFSLLCGVLVFLVWSGENSEMGF